jgi:lipopolysaccharide transport system permease protein
MGPSVVGSHEAIQGRLSSLGMGLGPSRRERIARFTNLLLALVRRDVTARYRRSVLGPAWAIIQPLVLMVLFTMIRGFVDIPSEGVPYIIFSYSALVPWTFFSNAVNLSGPSIYSNGAIIKKIALPREVFPLAAVVTALFDFAMASLVLVGMMLWFRVPVGWLLLWLLPLVVLTALLAFAVGMGVAALGTFRRDVILATPFLMQFWLYATPIIYPLSSVPERWRTLYMLNPTVGLIESFRNVLVKGMAPPAEALVWSALMTALALAVAWPLFRSLSQYFADVL